MVALNNNYQKIIKYDLLNKFYYNNIKKIPELQKVTLNFACKTPEIKFISSSLLALELISYKRGCLVKSRKPSLMLKIRKGHPVGCALTLQKTQMYDFVYKISSVVLPNSKEFTGLTFKRKGSANSFTLTINQLACFEELKGQFYLFNRLPPLNVNLVTNTANRSELFYLLRSFRLPFIKN